MKIRNGILAIAAAGGIATMPAFAEQTAQDEQAQSQQQTMPDSQTSAARTSEQVPPPVSSSFVQNVQQALQQRGHNINPDGIWGPDTYQALRDFQQQEGLQPSGQIDQQTIAALNLEQTQTASAQQPTEQQSTAQQPTEQQQATNTQAQTPEQQQAMTGMQESPPMEQPSPAQSATQDQRQATQ
jgi:peptidoglycan hydrolase-like protein with peptidoglycan-binding domain